MERASYVAGLCISEVSGNSSGYDDPGHAWIFVGTVDGDSLDVVHRGWTGNRHQLYDSDRLHSMRLDMGYKDFYNHDDDEISRIRGARTLGPGIDSWEKSNQVRWYLWTSEPRKNRALLNAIEKEDLELESLAGKWTDEGWDLFRYSLKVWQAGHNNCLSWAVRKLDEHILQRRLIRKLTEVGDIRNITILSYVNQILSDPELEDEVLRPKERHPPLGY